MWVNQQFKEPLAGLIKVLLSHDKNKLNIWLLSGRNHNKDNHNRNFNCKTNESMNILIIYYLTPVMFEHFYKIKVFLNFI